MWSSMVTIVPYLYVSSFLANGKFAPLVTYQWGIFRMLCALATLCASAIFYAGRSCAIICKQLHKERSWRGWTAVVGRAFGPRKCDHSLQNPMPNGQCFVLPQINETPISEFCMLRNSFRQQLQKVHFALRGRTLVLKYRTLDNCYKPDFKYS